MAKIRLLYPTPDYQSALVAIRHLISDHWATLRTPVSRACDELIDRGKHELGGIVFSARPGSCYLDWQIPKQWEVRSGTLRDRRGMVLADFNRHHLHLWMHSVAIDREVSRRELLRHLCVNPHRPRAIPFHFRNTLRPLAREWGFSLPYAEFACLGTGPFRVRIDAEFNQQRTLKVLEYVLPGESRESVLIAAHTCHPMIVTDGIAPIAVAVELFRALSRVRRRFFTYRLVIGPEYYAAAVYLARTGNKSKRIIGGIFLDLLGSANPVTYQHSLTGNSALDRAAAKIFGMAGMPFRGLFGNDEIFYNGPGYGIPMIGIGSRQAPYYHTSDDDFNRLNMLRLRETIRKLWQLVSVLEKEGGTDSVPLSVAKGPWHLSRRGVEPLLDRHSELWPLMTDLQLAMDGKRTCRDLAAEFSLTPELVQELCRQLAHSGAIRIKLR